MPKVPKAKWLDDALKWGVLHPKTGLGALGAVQGGLAGASNALSENLLGKPWDPKDKGGSLGKSKKWKEKHKKEHRSRLLRRTLGGAAVGGAVGVYYGNKITKLKSWQNHHAANTVPSWLKGVSSKKDATSRMRTEARKHHPDRGGSHEKMVNLNTQWEQFQKSDKWSKLKESMYFGFFDELGKME